MTAVAPDADRSARLRALVARQANHDVGARGTAAALDRLCAVAVTALPASGAVVSLMTGDRPVGVVAASAPCWREVEETQFLLGEGPAWDAYDTRRHVLAADVQSAAETRWPEYCAAVTTYGVRTTLAVPLVIGKARLGVLGIYRNHVSEFGEEALAAALVLAELATAELLDGQAHTRLGATPEGIDEALVAQLVVYQAQGMIMMQLRATLTEAMSRMRGYAYSHDRILVGVARDVVARRLVFDRDDR